MSDATSSAYMPVQQNPLRRAESWLDARGKLAWIGATVLGLVVFWPVGLALLAYTVFGGKLRGRAGRSRSMASTLMGSSGNSAFDAYRDQTIQRLEDEQARFEAFLKRLRDAKDQAEFDAFMAERDRERGRKTEMRDDDVRHDDAA